jgi:hypothetical protein
VTATTQKLNELKAEQAASFHEATTKLDTLSSSQSVAFKDAAIQLTAIHDSQHIIQASQRDVISTVADAKREVEELKMNQIQSFREASDAMADIARQSKEAEERVQSLLQQVVGGINRLITLDYSLLGEFFKVSTHTNTNSITQYHRTYDILQWPQTSGLDGAFVESVGIVAYINDMNVIIS